MLICSHGLGTFGCWRMLNLWSTRGSTQRKTEVFCKWSPSASLHHQIYKENHIHICGTAWQCRGVLQDVGSLCRVTQLCSKISVDCKEKWLHKSVHKGRSGGWLILFEIMLVSHCVISDYSTKSERTTWVSDRQSQCCSSVYRGQDGSCIKELFILSGFFCLFFFFL